jgi:hypothetical protein
VFDVVVKFAVDSLLEGDGFELSVPREEKPILRDGLCRFFPTLPSETDPIRLPLPVEMSQQGTPEL